MLPLSRSMSATERDQSLLEHPKRFQLVLRIHHLGAEAIAGALERVELGAACELGFEPLTDVVAEGVEAVEPPFELLDGHDPCADARHLRIELGDGFVEAGCFLGGVLDQIHLAEDRVHLRFELGGARRQRGHPIAECLERDPIAAELVTQLRDVRVRLVEVLHFLAQDVEVGAALTQRVQLPRGLLGEIVHLSEALVQRLERELFLGQLVGLGEQRIDPLGQQVEFWRQLQQILVLRAKRFHARLGVADRGLQRADPLVEGFEFSLADGQGIHLPAHRVPQGDGFLDELVGIALDLLLRLGGQLELGACVLGDFLDAPDRFFRPGRLLHPLVDLADLHVHGPDDFVHAIGLNDGVLDSLLLALDRLALARDVLGECVERAEALFDPAAQLLQLAQGVQLRLDLFHHRDRGGRVIARLTGCVADSSRSPASATMTCCGSGRARP